MDRPRRLDVRGRHGDSLVLAGRAQHPSVAFAAAVPAGADAARPGRLSRFRKACRAVQWGASAISICFVVAVVFMVGQPR